jgi:hypothetical protein
VKSKKHWNLVLERNSSRPSPDPAVPTIDRGKMQSGLRVYGLLTSVDFGQNFIA